MTGDSLSGKNGTDVSPVPVQVRLPRAKRTRLWKRLKKLDRSLNYWDTLPDEFRVLLFRENQKMYKKLDEKRKQVRRRLKGYND